jgi:hypothetical protein
MALLAHPVSDLPNLCNQYLVCAANWLFKLKGVVLPCFSTKLGPLGLHFLRVGRRLLLLFSSLQKLNFVTTFLPACHQSTFWYSGYVGACGGLTAVFRAVHLRFYLIG